MSTVILGAGITGLSAGFRRRRMVCEQLDASGGICASYYVDGNGGVPRPSGSRSSYRFEKGGGHWIFGSDPAVLTRIRSLSPVKTYRRKASVFLPDLDCYIPYPLQNHLYLLPARLRAKVVDDLTKSSGNGVVKTMKDWLAASFGKTLCELFFFPFHESYTAGLYARIAPQDAFKVPMDRAMILKGLKGKTPATGYNTTFIYPCKGLDHLIRQLESGCRLQYQKQAVHLDLKKKRVLFQDGTDLGYTSLISTLPLDVLVRISGARKIPTPDPYTSVLVLNIGAARGRRCPDDHWVYVPQSRSGFHRVGFYSNIDRSFLPATDRARERVSIYVEKAFLPGQRPDGNALSSQTQAIVNELISWGYIKDVEVVSPTWVEHGYTWQTPASAWRQEAISFLKGHDISSIGRYGAWRFQGILESMKDGFNSG
ncbi:MAG: protoporphyrinogen oxidase-like protein [Candidatus Omnitrophica bacterium]|nr:protoporphyrinogen oxidase-like protein [Candidatus Omnitrophota bacterium]